MGRSKNDLIEDMNAMVIEMKKALQVIDLDFKIPEGLEAFGMDWIRAGFKWLDRIYDNEFARWKKIRKSVSEEQWERYKSWDDCDDFQEVVLLTACNVALRKSLVSRLRADLFKKTLFAKELKRIESGNKRKNTRPEPAA